VDTVQGFLLARPSIDRSRLQVWQTRDWLQRARIGPGTTAPVRAYVE